MNKRSDTLTAVATLLFLLLIGIVLIATVSGSEKKAEKSRSTQTSETEASAVQTTTTTRYFGYDITADAPASVRVGESVTVVGRTSPVTPGVEIMWYSSDNDTARVTLDGVITGVKEGTVLITAKAIDPDNYNAPELTFELKVTNEADPNAASLPEGNRELMLVNVNNKASADYVPPELVRIDDSIPVMHAGLQVDRTTLAAYKRLYKALTSAKVGEVYVISAYRSYERQSEIFEDKVNELMTDGVTRQQAEKKASLTVNPPGCSEHQLGNTLDLSTNGETQHNFAELPQGRWIAENAHLYGFIIRYPSDKEEITGISYEPWHLRYVGQEHAMYMFKQNLCLEEYIQL